MLKCERWEADMHLSMHRHPAGPSLETEDVRHSPEFPGLVANALDNVLVVLS